ncbi:MAG: hypothetical protein ACLTR6_04880 [Clostridium fessum]
MSMFAHRRAQADEVVGKIYNNCAATILDTVDGEGGKWYHIQSGSVTGYIKAQYFATGEEASKIAREVGTTYAEGYKYLYASPERDAELRGQDAGSSFCRCRV